mgnify:CR=1 FL=1
MLVKRMDKIVFLLIAFLLTGCGTVKFTQNLPDGYSAGSSSHEKWHDTTIDGMVEISEPVNLYQECRGKPWAEIEIEYTFSNSMVAIASSSVLSFVVPALSFVSPYTPWAYEIRCGVYQSH